MCCFVCSDAEEGDGVARTSVSRASPEPELEIDTDAETEQSPESDSDSSDRNTHSESTICLSQCCKDSEVLDVYQTKDKVVLSHTKKQQGNRSRQFRSDWYDLFPWLVLCVTKLRAFCAYCTFCVKRKLLTNQLGDKAFVVNGFCNWKKALSVFRQHEK